jgi:hypothetical protein
VRNISIKQMLYKGERGGGGGCSNRLSCRSKGIIGSVPLLGSKSMF